MNAAGVLDRIRMVLVATTHPGNIGAAARAMKTMGLGALYLVNPKRFPDPQAEAMAAGAADILERAVVCESLDEALGGTTFALALTARRRDLSHDMLPLRDAASHAVHEARRDLVAVVFGTEMSGLSNAELDKCQLLATIPTSPEYGSLNLAAAVQVAAYELRLAALGPNFEKPDGLPPATHQEIEHFYQHLEQTLYDSGFLDPDEPKRLMRRLRRLFARARLEREEVNILRGILNALSKRVE